MNKLFVLSGASGAGKSTLLNRLVLDGYCAATPKYSERKRYSTIDDILTVENTNALEILCDLIYSMYGNTYGFSSKSIKAGLLNSNQVLVSNDRETIEKLKSLFPNQVVVIYIVSDINIDVLKQIYMKRYGFPSLTKQKNAILENICMAKEKIIQNETKTFLESLERISKIIDTVLFEDEGFKLRAESIKHREQLYSNRLFIYDYVVLNFYSSNVSTVHATTEAYEQLKKIIAKESNEDDK